MTPVDVQLFTATLNAVTEVFGNKPVPPKAIEIWFDTLREFETPRVVGCIRSWPKSHGKFPTPADVWKSLNEDATRNREEIAAVEKKAFSQGYQRLQRSPESEARFQEAMALLKTPKPTPEQHWRKVLATPGLCEVSYKAARAYLARFAPVQREPGQDDEEISIAHGT